MSVQQQASTGDLLSIVVPMYNESEVIDTFFSLVVSCLNDIGIDWEIICVNDGSSDNTEERIRGHIERDSRIKLVSFSRNFGKEAAMSAALEFASGNAIIPIDADLQDPPEMIAEMIEKWRDGYQVVYAKRVSRDSDSFLKRSTAGWFYHFFNKISDTAIPENVGDFRLMDRRVVEVIRSLPEKDRFMKGLFSWPGFEATTVTYSRQERESGETKFNYWKLWNFALSGITSFSTFPIRVSTYLGLLIALFSFAYGTFIVFRTLMYGVDTPGYASTIVIILFLGGIQLVGMGMLGEYVGRIYKEVKNRPLYVVDKVFGFDDS